MPTRSAIPTIISTREIGDVNQPDCDCDCAPSSSSVALNYNSLSTNHEHLHVPSDLYEAPLDGDYFLLFNPTAPIGQVVVVDQFARDIISCLRNNSSIKHAIAEFAARDCDIEAVRAAIIELNRLSILLHTGATANADNKAEKLVAWIHVTNACNLRCSYCYLNKTADRMSLDVGIKAINAIFRSARYHKYNSVKVKFSGGEATLNFDLVLQLYDYASIIAQEQHLGLGGVILSNGVRITQQMAEEILKRRIELVISLDGIGHYNDVQRKFASGYGSFSSVARTIDRLLECGLVPKITITVTGRNIDGLPDLLRYVLGQNLPFSLNFYRENGCSASLKDLEYSEDRMIEGILKGYSVIEEFMPPYSLLGAIADKANFVSSHDKTCGVGENYVVIDQKGNVAKCQMTIEQKVGAVDAHDIISLVREDQIGIKNLSVHQKEGCRDCMWKNWCAGGCPLATFRATGRYDVKSPNCRIYKAIYPQLLRLEGLRILRRARSINCTNPIPSKINLALTV